MPDLRFGRPSGMVVQGTRVDPLPPRPRWEALEEKKKGSGECSFKAYHRRTGITLGAHIFKGVLHRDGSE